MHPTTIDAIRAAMAEAGFAGAYDALAESHAELVEALESFRDYPCIGKDSGCGDPYPCAGCEARITLTKAHALVLEA